MTALETLIANSINFASVGTELYCTTTSLDSVDDEYKSILQQHEINEYISPQ